MNDIEILKEMFVCAVQVPLQRKRNQPPYVELIDTQANTTIEIKGLPCDSIVIRAEDFKDPLTVFKGSKGERKRADFVIVSNDGIKKWIIYIEVKRGSRIPRDHIIAQLRGAQCIMDYCKSIGREFWSAKGFLKGYEYRFVGIARLSIQNQPTRVNTSSSYSKRQLHSRPDAFLRVLGRQSLYFNELT
ncbi:hypothetical protein F4X33_01950 [Candidatus Poribacteria bacterium]|nr:hypothetical protein [Candidatus Poribacteria bacterium]